MSCPYSKLLEKNDVVAQKRTSSNKKLVIYKNNSVIKGPYFNDESRLWNIVERNSVLLHWNIEHIIYFNELIKIDCNDVCYYISYPKIGLTPPSINYNENFKNNSLNYLVSSISINKSYIGDEYIYPLSYILNNKNYNIELPRSLFYTLLILYILGVGDINTRNILIKLNKNSYEFYINDIEDNSTKKDDEIIDDEFYLNKKSSKNIIYNLLKKYYDEESFLFIKNLDKRPFKVDGYIKDKVNSLKRRNRILRFLKDYINGNNVIKEDKLKYIGPTSGTITFHGFKNSLLISALQKNIRRGNFKQSLFCAFELLDIKRTNELRHVHNMFNRLKIISCEDLSPIFLSLQSDIIKWVIDIINNKRVLYEYDQVLYELYYVIYRMCYYPKSRIMSHLKKSFTTLQGRKYYSKLSKNKLIYNKEITWDNILDYYNDNYMKKYLIGYGDKISKVLSLIHHMLENKNKIVIKFIYLYIENTKNIKIKKHKLTGKLRADILLYDVFSKFISKNELDGIILGYTSTKSKIKGNYQNLTFINTIICNILYKSNDYIIEDNELGLDFNNMNLNQNLIDKLLYYNYNIIIEDYMKDIHTCDYDKKLSKSELRNQFTQCGAIVGNQDERAYDEIMKEVYEINF